MTVTADDLDTALGWLVTTLTPAVDRDWAAPAESPGRDCWHVAEHVGDTLLSYATQLVARPDGRYVRFLAGADADATPAEVLEFAEASGRVLAAVVRTVPARQRAYHPSGWADPEGFAAMACAEVLLHGDDIARALGHPADPPAPLCARVTARLFPDAAGAVTGVDPWSGLRWCTGRTELPGRPRRETWQWRGAPIGG
ncbi:hypothetical protein K7640_22475 [Micromonospora sp. PLK6-60]|uniref:hypothetical protein n=1 Tax=Micromonospora sp. PLK6-60 TaxID=2873383 RepID=UPI001CA6724B|nr:hypothetical protein [Micromonospora sp. PLK6-60]MBY8874598.1 hypothetical protein [Micromonospora sp. PLK6-60]